MALESAAAAEALATGPSWAVHTEPEVLGGPPVARELAYTVAIAFTCMVAAAGASLRLKKQ